MNTSFQHWLEHNATGQDLIKQETDFFKSMLDEYCGQNIVQLGSKYPVLIENPAINIRYFSVGISNCDVMCNLEQLPFRTESIDTFILPHTLEFNTNPHQIIHESSRALALDGKLIISMFNPYSPWLFSSLWGKILPPKQACIRLSRLKDWLRLLGFEIRLGKFMVYTPIIDKNENLQKLNFCNHIGNRWLPQSAAVYGLCAVKRTYNVRAKSQKNNETEYVNIFGNLATAQVSNKNITQ